MRKKPFGYIKPFPFQCWVGFVFFCATLQTKLRITYFGPNEHHLCMQRSLREDDEKL